MLPRGRGAVRACGGGPDRLPHPSRAAASGRSALRDRTRYPPQGTGTGGLGRRSLRGARPVGSSQSLAAFRPPHYELNCITPPTSKGCNRLQSNYWESHSTAECAYLRREPGGARPAAPNQPCAARATSSRARRMPGALEAGSRSAA
ncbi:hypothetical protein GCM10009834_50630 [Streptomonospora arabica]